MVVRPSGPLGAGTPFRPVAAGQQPRAADHPFLALPAPPPGGEPPSAARAASLPPQSHTGTWQLTNPPLKGNWTAPQLQPGQRSVRSGRVPVGRPGPPQRGVPAHVPDHLLPFNPETAGDPHPGLLPDSDPRRGTASPGRMPGIAFQGTPAAVPSEPGPLLHDSHGDDPPPAGVALPNGDPSDGTPQVADAASSQTLAFVDDGGVDAIKVFDVEWALNVGDPCPPPSTFREAMASSEAPSMARSHGS